MHLHTFGVTGLTPLPAKELFPPPAFPPPAFGPFVGAGGAEEAPPPDVPLPWLPRLSRLALLDPKPTGGEGEGGGAGGLTEGPAAPPPSNSSTTSSMHREGMPFTSSSMGSPALLMMTSKPRIWKHWPPSAAACAAFGSVRPKLTRSGHMAPIRDSALVEGKQLRANS